MKFPDYESMLEYWREVPQVDTPTPTTKAELFADLCAEEEPLLLGRDLMVHSSYRCLKPVEGGPKAVLEVLKDIVGERGVLLMPTFDFQSWTETGYWSKQDSVSKMGILTELARLDPDFKRTSHPVLSFAVYSKDPEAARGYLDSFESHGPDSVFHRLMVRNGNLLSIGALEPENVGFNDNNVGFTYIHHVEACRRVPYRQWKAFEGTYVDELGPSRRLFTCYVSKPGTVTQVSPAMRAMEREGVVGLMKLGRTKAHVASARDVFYWVWSAVETRPYLLRKVKRNAR